MAKIIIRDRLTRKPAPHKGMIFKKKSRTIPGQDLTPTEILRNFVTKRNLVVPGSENSSGYFDDMELDHYRKMDEMDRIDMIREKRAEVQKLRDDLKLAAQAQFEENQKKVAEKAAPQSVDMAGKEQSSPKKAEGDKET